jgi:hypothetical protein
MSISAGNPKVLSTPSPIGLPEERHLAADSKTWKAGELCYFSSGTIAPLSSATGGSAVYGILPEAQSTATSTSTVNVLKLEEGTRLQMAITNNGTDAASSALTKGTGYDAYTKSNVSYIDANGTTGAQFKVIDTFENLNEELASYHSHTSSSTPGIVIVEFRAVSAT